MGKDGFDSEHIKVDVTGHALKLDQPDSDTLPKATTREQLIGPLEGKKTAHLIEQLSSPHAAAMRLIDRFSAPNAALRIIEQFNASDNAARRIVEQFNASDNAARRVIEQLNASDNAARRFVEQLDASDNAARRVIEQLNASDNAARRIIEQLNASDNAARRIIEQLNVSDNAASRIIEQFNSLDNSAATRAIQQFHALNDKAATRAIAQFQSFNNNASTRAIEQFQSVNSKAATLAIEHLFSVKDMQIAKVIEQFNFPLKPFKYVLSHFESGSILADASVGTLLAELERRSLDVTAENGYGSEKLRNRSSEVHSAAIPAVNKDKQLHQPGNKNSRSTDQNLSELPTWLLRFMLNLLIASITAVAQWDQIRASVVDINARFPKTESFIEARNFIRTELSGKPGDIRLVKGSNVNLREDPGMKSAVILQLSENSPVVVMGKEDRTWLWVSYEHEGYWIDGYVSTKHLKNPRKNRSISSPHTAAWQKN